LRLLIKGQGRAFSKLNGTGSSRVEANPNWEKQSGSQGGEIVQNTLGVKKPGKKAV